MDILEKIFGNANKIVLMRLFLMNPEVTFSLNEVVKKTKIKPAIISKEISIFVDAKLIIHIENKKEKINGFLLNKNFKFLESLRRLFLITGLPSDEDIRKSFDDTGRIKLIITSGVFIDKEDSRVDLVIVGDTIKPTLCEKKVREMEVLLGKEIRYCVFETEDFKYRHGLFDKLIRDILDYPHNRVVDKLMLQ